MEAYDLENWAVVGWRIEVLSPRQLDYGDEGALDTEAVSHVHNTAHHTYTKRPPRPRNASEDGPGRRRDHCAGRWVARRSLRAAEVSLGCRRTRPSAQNALPPR